MVDYHALYLKKRTKKEEAKKEKDMHEAHLGTLARIVKGGYTYGGGGGIGAYVPAYRRYKQQLAAPSRKIKKRRRRKASKKVKRIGKRRKVNRKNVKGINKGRKGKKSMKRFAAF